MSRSLKSRHSKNGIFMTWCKGSNKKDKRIANRLFRRKSKLNINNVDETKLAHDLDEVSNTYNFSTDGLASYISIEDDEKLKKYKRK